MELVKNRRDYYSKPFVILELVKQLKYKYLSARKKILDENGKEKWILTRYYLGYEYGLLQQSLEKLNVLNDISAKIYFDLSTWKDEEGITPMFNFAPENRKIDRENFNKFSDKYFKGYDFAIDLDSEDLSNSYKDAKKLKKRFDYYKLPYSIKFSGGKGFHFLIEDKWFDSKIKPMKKVELCGKLSKIITADAKIKSVKKGGTFDDTIYDFRRILKLAYSLQNKNGKEYVCLPLTDEQFDNFKVEDMELDNVMRRVHIKERGLLTRNFGLTDEQLSLNLKKFIKKECRL